MIKIAFIAVLITVLCGGCNDRQSNDRQSSPTMRSFSPSTIVLKVAKSSKLDLAETGGGQEVNSGHENKDWHYASESKVVDLEAVVREIHNAFQQELTKLGANIHGKGAETHGFIVYTLTYNHGFREGTLRIIGATLEKGTALDIVLDEHPE